MDQAEFRSQRRQDIRMHDWEAFLDKFLRDTELPVLADSGTVAHDRALTWAHEQYEAFSERRRLEAEAEGERRYLDDLRDAAEVMEAERKKQKILKASNPARQKKEPRYKP